MSVFDLFRKPQPQQQQQPAQGQQQAPAESAHVTTNQTVPNSTNTPQQNPSAENPNPESPNSNFADMWKMEAQQGNGAPNFNIDPGKLRETAGKLDFASAVSRDDLAKIAQGGEDAVKALANVLNQVGQNVFSANAQFASQLTDSGYRAAQQSIDRGLPNLVKKQFAQNDLFSNNQKLRDPALQPLAMAIQSQLADRHPNATPAEVNAMVEKYFKDVVAPAFQKEEQQNQQGSNQSNAFDFSSFLS